jgi:hypothetical protein
VGANIIKPLLNTSLKILENLKDHFANLPGWSTRRKIVVFESDDWGEVRIPSKKVYEKLIASGIRADKCAYMKYDSLASQDDLTALFQVLTKYKDANDKRIKFTANTIVANPDFEKIKASHFENYDYELFTESLNRYPNHVGSFQLWQEGMEQDIFHPQLHGREHLNISRWIRDLKNGVSETRTAFDLGVFGLSGHVASHSRGSYLSAFDGGENESAFEKPQIVSDAIEIFKSIFGYIPASFIAPNYVWGEELEQALGNGGVKFIQGTNAQRLPRDFGDKLRIKRHFLGNSNEFGMRYLVRNAYFEPSLNPAIDNVSECLAQVNRAFLWNKPAIISTHRLNYIGNIVEENRNQNLKLLDELLHQLFKRWPSIEVYSSDELGHIINSDRN